MRSALDLLYRLAGSLAAVCLVAIALLVLWSIGLRLIGAHVPGLANYAGYAMAAGSFLALAYTFGHGAHIRVGLVIQRFSGRARRLAELWCLVVAGGLAVYFAGYAIKMVRVSYKIHDVSQGADATPLWIPQVAMAVGAVIFAIALVDRLVAVVRGADPEQDPLVAPGARPTDTIAE